MENQNNTIKYKDHKSLKLDQNIKVKQIMENNLLTLRKQHNNKKIISKIKNSNISLYSSIEKNYIISNSSFIIPNILIEYYNNSKNKNLFLYQGIINIDEMISKFNIDKNNLIKFILYQLNDYITYILNIYDTSINTNTNNNNINIIKNFFDENIINKLILILHEYSNTNNNSYCNNHNINISDNEIILYNICHILIQLTHLSNYYTFLIINNDNDNNNNININNINIIFSSLKKYNKINQFLSNNLLILIHNCYIDYPLETLNKCNNLISFILENLSNYQNNPKDNMLQLNYLLNLIEFLSKILNTKNNNNNNIYINNFYIYNCILLMINIYLNYNDNIIKQSSLKCLSSLLSYCVEIDLNINLKIDNIKSLIQSLLPNLNIEINETIIVINTLEIISSLTYLLEIDDFVNNELINEINEILISLIIHGEQIKINLGEKNFNGILEIISIILLNSCFSSKVCEYIVYNTSIKKNIILIIYNYSNIEISTIKNFYNFLNEFMDNENNFMSLILSNFLEIGIVKSLDKYIDLNYYDIIFIILNFAYKSLEYGNIFRDKNTENKNKNNKINFVQSFLDKKGFNDKLNLIISPDFGNLKCSELAKKIQENFFL